jgi:hypothetical protein
LNYFKSSKQLEIKSCGIFKSLWAGNDANRLIRDKASSRSFKASAKVGYRSLTK